MLEADAMRVDGLAVELGLSALPAARELRMLLEGKDMAGGVVLDVTVVALDGRRLSAGSLIPVEEGAGLAPATVEGTLPDCVTSAIGLNERKTA